MTIALAKALDAAEMKLNAARGNLSKIGSVKKQFEARKATATTATKQHEKELASAEVARALGEPFTDIMVPRGQHEIAQREFDAASRGLEEVTRRHEAADEAVAAATTPYEHARMALTKYVYDTLRQEARDAFRAFAKAQRRWITVAAAGNALETPYHAPSDTLLGAGDDPGSLRVIGRAEGIYLDAQMSGVGSITPVSLEAIRTLAVELAGGMPPEECPGILIKDLDHCPGTLVSGSIKKRERVDAAPMPAPPPSPLSLPIRAPKH